MHETLLRHIYCKNNLFITSTHNLTFLSKNIAWNFVFFDNTESEIVVTSQKVTWITRLGSYPDIPNKVNDIMRLPKQHSARLRYSSARYRKTRRRVHILTNEFNEHYYGWNRLVFGKLQSVVSSVLIGVKGVRPSTLSDRNTGAYWNLTDLTFHSWRTGLLCWLRAKVVLDFYSAVVEMLSCWVVGWTWHWHLRWKKGRLMSGR